MILVGYGDIHPSTTLEKGFNIFFMMIGTGIFGYSLN